MERHQARNNPHELSGWPETSGRVAYSPHRVPYWAPGRASPGTTPLALAWQRSAASPDWRIPRQSPCSPLRQGRQRSKEPVRTSSVAIRSPSCRSCALSSARSPSWRASELRQRLDADKDKMEETRQRSWSRKRLPATAESDRDPRQQVCWQRHRSVLRNWIMTTRP